MKRNRYIEPGTHRGNRRIPALNPQHVKLDPNDAAGWMKYAIAYAKKLRFVPDENGQVEWEQHLQNATQDWSGFLGEENGEILESFKLFLADPENFEASSATPISQPHVALFISFLQTLDHAKKELNHFSSRHLDHYFNEILEQKPLKARPATTYVQMQLGEEAPSVLIPQGKQLKAALQPEGTVHYETKADLELHEASIGELRSLGCKFEPTGLRNMLNPAISGGGMIAIRAHIWPLVKANALAAERWESFDEMFTEFVVRENQRDFPLVLLQLRVDEFLQMMTLKPKNEELSEIEEALFRKWEYLYSYMSIRADRPAVEPPSILAVKTLREKLEAALFLGDELPPYKGAPVDLKVIFQDSIAENKSPDIKLATSYIRNQLFMGEDSFQVLYDLSENRNVLPIRPDAIQEAIIRKAATINSDCVRQVIAAFNPSDELQLESETEKWHPFAYDAKGEAQLQPIENLGIFVESQVLAMAEGTRKIDLKLEFAEIDFAAFVALFDTSSESSDDWWVPFLFNLTAEKEWVKAAWAGSRPTINLETREVKFELEIAPELPAIAAPGEKFPDAGLVGKGPMLAIQLEAPREELNGVSALAYRTLCQSLRLEKITVDVNVEGLATYQIENQEGLIDPEAPFKPFGTDPGPGANMKIAHPELCLKPLKALRLSFNWLELPNDLEAQYDGYFAQMGNTTATKVHPHTQSDFKTYAEFVVGPRSTRIESSAIPFLVEELELEMDQVPKLANSYTAADAENWKSMEDWPRYLRLRYAEDWFPEIEYNRAERRLSAALSQASVDFSLAATAYAQSPAGSTNGKTNLAWYQETQSALNALSLIALEPPYQPEVASFAIGYSATIEIDLAGWKPEAQPAFALYHRMPFGIKQLPTGNGMPLNMFPVFSKEGAFLLGLKDMEAGKPISILMKVLEGSGNPDVQPPEIQWAYHSTKGWTNFPARNILEDQTKGLVETGLLRLIMPNDAANAGNELPGKMHWLKASVSEKSAAMPYFENLYLHVAEVQMVPPTEGEIVGENWDLPQNSITAFEENVAGVEEISQPYAATNGRPPESKLLFQQRVSERLRHKGRAVSAWDFEHLCLQEFPNVYAVKTIQSYASFDRRPGEVGLVVVPDLRNKKFADPYQPKFGFGELNAITSFAKLHASSFARVRAFNPNYRPVMVDATISFKDGISPTMGKYLIHDRLKRFLAPWAFDTATNLAFGGRLYVSQVVEVLQAEPYVDFIGKTKIFVSDADGKYEVAHDFEKDGAAYIEVEADDVLTSAASHLINELEDKAAKDEIWEGISWMIINTDFKVAVDPNIQPETFEEWMGISWMVIAEDFNLPLDE